MRSAHFSCALQRAQLCNSWDLLSYSKACRHAIGRLQHASRCQGCTVFKEQQYKKVGACLCKMFMQASTASWGLHCPWRLAHDDISSSMQVSKPSTPAWQSCTLRWPMRRVAHMPGVALIFQSRVPGNHNTQAVGARHGTGKGLGSISSAPSYTPCLCTQL